MNILIVTMSLGIGGAETHITELCLALKEKGHSVTAVSNGGVYAERLGSCGIRHICAPLHTKDPVQTVRAYKILLRELTGTKYDIVHAHARIPGFVCGRLWKKLRGTDHEFRFVTTCHGKFEMNLLWKLVADWGQRSLAVSCDIKDYLINSYSYPSSNIALTINGIDCNKFSPCPDDRASVIEELGADPSCRSRIIFVGRVDEASLEVPMLLCNCASDSRLAGCEFVIIGGGDALEALEKEAGKVNSALGRKAVFALGARTDIPRLLSCGDLFVGVSRAALEAMACGLPVILAGSSVYGQGYAGVFGSSLLGDMLDCNFTARNYPRAEESELAADLARLADCGEAERQAIGEYNRSVVLRHYPVSRMADDAEEVYMSLCMLPPKSAKHSEVVICGYYGYGNSGDDSLLRSIITSLRARRPGLSITVLSADPKETARQYDVRSIDRFNIFAVTNELRHASLLINGSGNLLQNSTSSRSLFYYTSLNKLAVKCGCRVMIYAGGIGPLRGEWAAKVSRETIAITDTVTLREDMSLDVMKQIGADCSKAVITADPALLLERADDSWVSFILSREKIDGRFFVIAMRDCTRENANEIVSAANAISKKYGCRAVFAVMQEHFDRKVSEYCAMFAGAPLLCGLNAAELSGIFARAEFVIGMRLHTLVYSASVGTPFIGLAYDLKIRAFAGLFEGNICLEAESADSAAISAAADRLLADRERIADRTIERAEELRVLAESDSERAVQLLDR